MEKIVLIEVLRIVTRQGKARQGKARQGKARQGKARQGKARQGKARQEDIFSIALSIIFWKILKGPKRFEGTAIEPTPPIPTPPLPSPTSSSTLFLRSLI